MQAKAKTGWPWNMKMEENLIKWTHTILKHNTKLSKLEEVNPTNGYVWQGKELEGGGQFDPPYLKALKSHSKVSKWV